MRSCSIEIVGLDLDPDEVSRRLDAKPSRAHCRGEISPPSQSPAHQGAWTVNSEQHVGPGALEEHICWSADFVTQHREALVSLRESGLTIRFRIFWELNDEVLSVSLSPYNLAVVASCVESIEVSIV
jgi:hypothetical protein